MLRFLRTLLNRYRALRHTRLQGDAVFAFHRDVTFILAEGSEIVIRGGGLRLGYPLQGTAPYASYPGCVVQLGRGARLICDGSVAIAPGATIRVGDGGTVRFEGDNLVAHNLTLLCEREVTIGQGAHLSWNVSLIDDDGHHPWDMKGRQHRRPYRPLRIGKRVGIQMNVQVPRGVTIGDLAAVGAGTVLRRDIPSQCIAYADAEIRIKEGLMPAPPLDTELKPLEL